MSFPLYSGSEGELMVQFNLFQQTVSLIGQRLQTITDLPSSELRSVLMTTAAMGILSCVSGGVAVIIAAFRLVREELTRVPLYVACVSTIGFCIGATAAEGHALAGTLEHFATRKSRKECTSMWDSSCFVLGALSTVASLVALFRGKSIAFTLPVNLTAVILCVWGGGGVSCRS